MTDLATRCAALGWTLREDGDGYELTGNGQPAYFRSAASVAAWLDKQRVSVKKQMPKLDHETTPIQTLRSGTYTMTDTIKAPFPWPGGKSDMAAPVWARFGVVENFVEPMCGSSAMLLGRPGGAYQTETVNDVDGLLINAYRAIQFAPDETAELCDWPVSEADLTARHLHLKAAREELTARLFADPLYCDPMLGAWWLWGIASWIGDGWCVADGPWIAVDGRLVDRRTIGSDEDGVWKQTADVSPNGIGKGIQSYRAAVPRQMPVVGAPGEGGPWNRGIQAYRHHDGVPKQMPVLDNERYMPGMAPSALAAYFARLSDRLRRVRFLCGDWRRACKDSVTVNHGLTAVFLDPPYPSAEHDMAYFEIINHPGSMPDGRSMGEPTVVMSESHLPAAQPEVWHQAAAWAVEKGDDKRLRIAIAGYYSEATDALFPSTWERVRWEARGGYANQKADGRGRANAKREIIWFSPGCLNPTEEARETLSRPIVVRESNFTGTMFEENDDV